MVSAWYRLHCLGGSLLVHQPWSTRPHGQVQNKSELPRDLHLVSKSNTTYGEDNGVQQPCPALPCGATAPPIAQPNGAPAS